MQARLWVVAVMLVALGGCASQRLHRTGMAMVNAGKVEEGLQQLGKAVEADPENVGYRQDYQLARAAALGRLLGEAQRQQAQGNTTAAEALFRQILAIEPASIEGAQGLARLRRSRLHEEWLAAARRAVAAGTPERALPLLSAILAEDPNHQAAKNLKRELETPQFREHFQELVLKDAYPQPINLEFRDASVRMVLEALSRTSGINFIFDKDVALDLRTTVVLRNANLDEVVDLILRNAQLGRKVLNNKTVQVYPDTPEKRRDYQELVVRAFYLQDASAVQIQTVLKTLLRMKDIVIDERLNLLTVRDTPDAVRLAERLIALHDLAEPEVMLEMEVLEVQRDDLLKLGVQWPNQLGVIPLAAGGTLTVDDLRKLNAARLGVSFTNPSLSLRQDHSVSNLLANPRIRVHHREKASILIGDKVPVITTTSNATGFVSENVQYLDVCLKLAAEPVIHPNNDVSLRLNMEVSSIAGQVSTPNGTVAYQVGTRNAATFLRLQDGETQVLAGLISDQDRRSASGVPGLSRLPILGRLFSAPSDSNAKTEIVLSVTPRVVRSAARPEQSVQFWSGTENGLSTRPLRLSDDKSEAQATPRNGAGLATPPAPPQPPQLIWGGPNQVAIGEPFTLSLRVKALEGSSVPPMQILVDPAVLEVSEVIDGRAGSEHGGGIHFERAKNRVDIDLRSANPSGAAMDGTLLSIRMIAIAGRGPTALKIVAANAVAADLALPYIVNVVP